MESLTKNRQSEEAVLQMVRRAFGNGITSDQITVRELTEGYFNIAYEVILPDRAVILKIAPPQGSKIMTYEHNMRAEVDALRMVKEKTDVPVPCVLYYDNTLSICDADYFFMEKIEGESFFKLKNSGLLSHEEQKEIYREIGRYNARMNEITGASFGYLGLPAKQGGNWKEVFLNMLEEVLRDGERIEISLGVGYDEVRSLIAKAGFALEEVKSPRFVHWDLWDGNIFIREGRITGIIDFERALWAEPLMEYSFRGHVNTKEFYDGYGANLREEAPVRSLLYDMYLYLIMVIETKYRMYPDDGQYGFAGRQLKLAMEKLKEQLLIN
jgi:aminoglycoside phosphotransferase (APT) family kinase protein